MERLGALVAGRTVGLLLHGSSVAGLADHGPDLAAAGTVWAGLNHFRLLEDRFLAPAGRTMSVVFCCADGEVARRLPDLAALLDRPPPRLLITRPDQFDLHRPALSPHGPSVLLESLPALWPYPNSLTLFLRLLVRCGPRRIVLCGADGYLGEDDNALPTYYGSEQFKREGRLSGVLRDTLLFNAHFPALLARWRAAAGANFPEILNCSPGTLLQGLPFLPRDQLGAALRGEPVTAVNVPLSASTPVPPRGRPDDPVPELVACANAARRGNLRIARQYALRALDLQPENLSQLAFRVLQTDRATLESALALLAARGAAQPGSPHHWRWQEFNAELTQARTATLRWETWS